MSAAALAFNLTAYVLSAAFGFSPRINGFGENGMCTPSQNVSSLVVHERSGLMFGNMTGLMEQPKTSFGSIIVFGARGGDDKSPGTEHRGDTIPICNSIIQRGWSCVPVFYSDEAHDDILKFAQRADGYISRVNPDVYEGVTMSKYEGLLKELSNRGLASMAHPELMQKFGSKVALANIGHLRTGLPDTVAYYDEQTFRDTFPVNLATGARVLKQNRGSQGEGIWICKLESDDEYRKHTRLPLDTMVILTEAVDNHVERKTLGELLDFVSQYFYTPDGQSGEVIDQVFMPRIEEGEVRVLFVGGKPAEIVHKKPREGGVSATLKSGAVYTRFAPDDPAFERLMRSFVKKDLPKLLPSLGLGDHPLPLLWTADFILGPARPPWNGEKDYYYIGELNCSCVGITTQLHLTDLVAAEAIKTCELHREKRKSARQNELVARSA